MCSIASLIKRLFLAGARALLKKLPDYVSPDWLNNTEDKAQVLPVPLDIAHCAELKGATGPSAQYPLGMVGTLGV